MGGQQRHARGGTEQTEDQRCAGDGDRAEPLDDEHPRIGPARFLREVGTRCGNSGRLRHPARIVAVEVVEVVEQRHGVLRGGRG
jgi:hypothetical protein